MKEVVTLSGRIPQWFSVQIRQHLGEGFGVRIGLGERQPYSPRGDAHLSSDLEQLQPKGGTLGTGQLGTFGAESSKRL